MGDIFTHAKRIDCLVCPGRGRMNRKPELMLQSRNYSGSGTDMGVCPECGRSWNISYTIEKMTREPSWDEPSRKEKELQEKKLTEQLEREAEANDRETYEILKKRYGD